MKSYINGRVNRRGHRRLPQGIHEPPRPQIVTSKGSAHIRVEIQHKGGPSLGVSPERSCGVAGLQRPQHFVDAALERTLARRDPGLDELVDWESAFLAELEDR